MDKPAQRLEQRSWLTVEAVTGSDDGESVRRDPSSSPRFGLAVVGVIAVAQLLWIGLLGYTALELVVL